MPRVPGLDPAEGGGAAQRRREFEQSRGIEDGEPLDRPVSEDVAEDDVEEDAEDDAGPAATAPFDERLQEDEDDA